MAIDSGAASAGPTAGQKWCEAGCAGQPLAGTTAGLRIAADLESLDLVARFVLELGRSGRLTSSETYRLRLAADELATNIVMHGYCGAPGDICVDGGVTPERVWVRFSDDAPPFDPRGGMKAPDLEVPLARRAVGGLGVFLALTAVDRFDYELVAGRNVSVLTIHRDHHG
ncbi:ATP-binding protein [Streptomyces sp. BK340]|uniref:ATP-binding protein n=1 Tax=Streptomyces sp. BK340 TaxID=2572903 RepID=UPI00119D6733|nr:ATP-binding protein [Streptomyces sp. BK340]TVZ80459.1 anti-sigma regulatory factor (Ser/Thr protein kinase) [Streptomyces sp. BK340]